MLSLMVAASLAYGDVISITDMSGRDVSVPFDPSKIVCLGPGALRTIVYLQAQDKVACIEGMEFRNPHGRPYWIAHSSLHTLPHCGYGGSAGINRKPDMEAVLASGAQVVFMTYVDKELADEIQGTLGIAVVVLRFGRGKDFDEAFYQSLKICGRILNRANRAREVIGYVESIKKDLGRRMEGAIKENSGVYIGAVGYRGAYGIESTEKKYLPFLWMGVKSIADAIASLGQHHIFVNKEMLLQLDPEIVFIDGGGHRLVREDYRKRPRYYRGLDAYSKRRIFSLLPYNMYATNVATAMINAYAVGKIAFPDRFEDIDLEAKANDIYTFMVGKSVYPAMKRDYGRVGQRVSF